MFATGHAPTAGREAKPDASDNGQPSKREEPAPAFLSTPEAQPANAETKPLVELLGRSLGLEKPPASLADIRLHTDVHFVIATIPNPERGPLAIYTDELLDAISSSAVDAGLLLDVHYLPWKSLGAIEPRAADAKKASLVVIEQQASVARSNPEHTRATLENAPAPPEARIVVSESPLKTEEDKAQLGALVFRSRAGTDLLVVLLVGESAVEGVDAKGLRNAIDIAGCERGRQWILGPSYSGSARKMWRVINESEADGCSAQIVSGSATGTLDESMLHQQHKLGRAMVSDDDLFDFLKHRLAENKPKAKLAVLSESGTGYAANFRAPVKDAKSQDRALHPDPSDQRTSGLRVRSYTFPLHVADLRFAHGRKSQALDDRLAPLQRSLDLDLSKVNEQNDDTLAIYSPMTPMSVEATLRSTFSAVARWSADYLMIVATDPADLLFLAEEARAYAPSAQLVTVSANALFEHASVASTLQGALIASSYPLGLDYQSWSKFCPPDKETCSDSDNKVRGPDRFKSFSSDGAQGVYTAMHWLLREAVPNTDKTIQPDRVDPITRRPGVRPWLSVIDGRAWPLRAGPIRSSCTGDSCIDIDRHDNAYLEPRPALADENPKAPFVRPTRLAVAWGVCVFAACLIQIFVFAIARLRSNMIASPLLRAFNRVTLDSPRAAVQYQAAAHLCLGLLGFALYIGASHSYSLSWVFRNWSFASGEDAAAAIVLTAGLPLVSFVLLALALFTSAERLWHQYVLRNESAVPDTNDKSCRGYVSVVHWIVTAFMLAAVAIVLVNLTSLHAALSSPDGPLYLIRLSDPLGPCPFGLLFFLAAGLYLWAILALNRAYAIARFTRTPPLRGIRFSPGTRLSDSNEEGIIWRSVTWELSLFAALIAPIILLNDRLQPTFEWSVFDLTVKALMLLLVSGVLFACLQAALFWSRLRRLLEDHAGTALIEAYSRIAGKVTASFGTQLRSHVPPPRELRVSVQNLELLYHLAGKLKLDNPIAQYIESVKPSVHVVLKQLKDAYLKCDEFEQPNASLERTVHDAFFSASAKVYEILENIWHLRIEHPSPPDEKDVPTDALLPAGRLSAVPTGFIFAASMPPDCLFWVRIAEDFVAMRFVSWTYHVLAQIRWLITFAIVGAVMLLCAVFAYPLQPHRFIVLFTGSILVVAAGASFRIIMGMQSNEILRRLAPGTQFGGLKLDLAKQVMTYVVLPVVLLAARIFPGFGESMTKVLAPMFSILQ